MSYLVRETFVNESGTNYNTLEEYKAWFYGKRDLFIDLVKQNEPGIYDSDIMNSLIGKITSEDFDATTQTYIRTADWLDSDSFNVYRNKINEVNWEVEPYLNLTDVNLGIVKSSEVI